MKNTEFSTESVSFPQILPQNSVLNAIINMKPLFITFSTIVLISIKNVWKLCGLSVRNGRQILIRMCYKSLNYYGLIIVTFFSDLGDHSIIKPRKCQGVANNNRIWYNVHIREQISLM